MKRIFFLKMGFLVTLLICTSCKTYYFRHNYSDVNTLLHSGLTEIEKPFLKAHLKNGNVVIFKDSWVVDSEERWIAGNGSEYDFKRNRIYNGPRQLPVDSVAIFETNTKLPNNEGSRIAALTLLAGVEVILGVICVTVPKACYGSCPTFYLDSNATFHTADAEGFSNAIAPSMVYTDIDALHTTAASGVISLTMKNEAMETHCLNSVNILAFPVHDDERVYHSPQNRFYLCKHIINLANATAGRSDVGFLLQCDDKQEYFSLSDSGNLSSKEEIIIDFQSDSSLIRPGLVLDFRQSLLTTYLVYNAMGYMGNRFSDVFAGIEAGGQLAGSIKEGLKKELGNIDVYSWNPVNFRWEFENSFYETGPIAINRQIIPITHSTNQQALRLKLVLNKGYWRLDRVALTHIEEEVEPVEIGPSQILNKGIPDPFALSLLNTDGKLLVSMPGSLYTLKYKLPETCRLYELFLSSTGYYLEWMRNDWLKDQDLLRLRMMVKNPSRYLKREAKSYKRFELRMEEIFWNSRIDPKNISYYEN